MAHCWKVSISEEIMVLCCQANLRMTAHRAFKLGKLPPGFRPDARLQRGSAGVPTCHHIEQGERPTRNFTRARWGLIPYWVKDAKVGFSAVNTRAETITTAPVFREAFQRRECLLRLAEVGREKQNKQAYAIRHKDG
jgi:hypothetical protein